MSVSALTQLEEKIGELSLSEQLILIERLVHRLHQSAMRPTAVWETELAAMASDPEIQNELRRINEEFSIADTDGLERA